MHSCLVPPMSPLCQGERRGRASEPRGEQQQRRQAPRAFAQVRGSPRTAGAAPAAVSVASQGQGRLLGRAPAGWASPAPAGSAEHPQVAPTAPAPAAAQSAPSSRRSAPCCLRRRCSGPSSRPSCRPSALRSPPSASVRAPKEALLRAAPRRGARSGASGWTLRARGLVSGSSPAPPGRRPRASTRAGQPAAHPRA
jgi:hypothetical protein